MILKNVSDKGEMVSGSTLSDVGGSFLGGRVKVSWIFSIKMCTHVYRKVINLGDIIIEI